MTQPWLDPKKAATFVTSSKSEPGTSEPLDASVGLEAAAQKLIQASKEGNASRVAEAFSEMWELKKAEEASEGEAK